MTLRFQADADLNQIILHAVIRREPTLDFQTAEAAGLMGLRDPEVLALAAREGRVLVTHDQKTMPRHFAAFITTEMSPGVLFIP
jgi:predicted nuclease of predicted toxin-antitoxin system